MEVIINMDTETALVLFGSAQHATKLLGPTAEYLGAGMRKWSEKRLENLKAIFAIASRRLGDRIEAQGGVPPKVLKEVVYEGSFCDDRLVAEYLNGVLASSRSGNPRDDRGATLVRLIAELSTYQIRSHYVFYHVVKRLFDGSDMNIQIRAQAKRMRAFVPISCYYPAMEFTAEEVELENPLLGHVLDGLATRGLTGSDHIVGPAEYMKTHVGRSEAGISFTPFSFGVELLLWAYGRSDLTAADFLQPGVTFALHSDVELPPGYVAVP